MKFLEAMLMRGGSFVVLTLCLMIVYVFGDIWRIERRNGHPVSATAISLLAAVILLIGIFFGSVAIYGCYPMPRPVIGGCP